MKNGLVEIDDGIKCWWINDKLHRVDGPAVEHPDGTKYWYINDKFHREDGPALVYPNGTKYWYLNGELLMKTKGEVTEKQLKIFMLKKLQ
jgi:hypothetical protein